jgi:hypothetical protein
MKKIDKLQLFLSHPVAVLNQGLYAIQEEQYRRRIEADHGIKQLPTVDLLDLFPGFSESIEHYTYLEGTSLVIDIMLLKAFARRFPNCAFLEIGSWRGESIANVHAVTKDCTSITLSAKEMREMGIPEGFVQVHGIFSKNLEGLRTIEHNSMTFDFSSLNKKFDLIFVDGDHTYEGVLSDTKNVFDLRKGPDSVIVWHDYAFTPDRFRPSVAAAILDGIPREYHKNLYHVSNTLCAVYLENCTLPTGMTAFPTRPNKSFSLSLTAHRL